MSEQRCAWGRAYRGQQLVCDRVRITMGRDDDRLGLAGYQRRYIVARFADRVDGALRSELTDLLRRRGAAARRIAERMAPIEIVIDDPRRGRQCMTVHLQPPQLRCGGLHDVEFALREVQQ